MASSRVYLHDCTLDIRLPILSHTTASQTADKIAQHAAATPTLDHTHAYAGSTLLILLTLTLPDSFEPTHSFLHHAADHILTLLSAPSSTPVRLPILTSSSWRPLPKRSLPRRPAFVKAVWALLNSTPVQASQTLCLTLGERIGSTSKNSTVWAAIDRASRFLGRTAALKATRPITILTPLQITTSVCPLPQPNERTLLHVRLQNIVPNADVRVDLALPELVLSSSRRLSRRNSITHVETNPALDLLPSLYVARLLNASLNTVDGDSDTVVRLDSNEVFSFVFILDRVDGTHGRPILHDSDVVQTDLRVAWRCTRDTDAALPKDGFFRRGSRAKRVSRSDMATVSHPVEWRPIALFHGIVISATAPHHSVSPGRTFVLNVRICNRGTNRLKGLRVILRTGPDGAVKDGVVALRSVVVVGTVDGGAEAFVQVPCVAVRAGVVKLGKIAVVSDAEDGAGGVRCWLAERDFVTLAAEEDFKNDAAEVELTDKVSDVGQPQ